MQDKPFIHKFRTDKNSYVYDVNSNQILRASPVEYDIIDDYGVLSENEIIENWSDRYGREEIRGALEGFDDLRERGLLSSSRPRKLDYSRSMVREGLDSYMRQLILNLTEECNQRCRYCLFSDSYPLERDHSRRSMPLEMAKKAIRYFREHSRNSESVHISFYGGEPLTCFDKIKELIIYANNLGDWPETYFHVDTNGTLMNERILDFMVENNVGLQISVDGPREIHDRYRVFRNGRPTFDRVMETVDMIRNKYPDFYNERVSVAATLAPPYDLRAVEEFFESDRFKRLTVSANFMQSVDTEFFNKQAAGLKSLRKETFREVAEGYISNLIEGKRGTNLAMALIQKAMAIIYRRNIETLGDTAPPNAACLPGVRRAFLDVDGNYYPCEKIGVKCYKIGDVDSGIDYSRVIKLLDDYIEHSEEECLNCWAVRLCFICYTAARRGEVMDFERKREECVSSLKNTHFILQAFMKVLEGNPNGFDFMKEMTFF